MDKNKELAKNTLIISIGKICTQFLSFFLLPVYTAILSTEEYGTVDLLTTYQQLIGYIAFFQIEQAIFRFLIDVRQDDNGKSTIITSTFSFGVMQAGVLGIIFAITNILIKHRYIGDLYMYVIAVIFSGFLLQTARGLGQNSLYAFGSFLSAISTIGFNIFFLVVLKLGCRGILLAFILGNTFCGIYLFFSLRIYKYIKRKSFSISSIKECLMYSIPLVPNVLSWWIMGASDRTIVSYILGTSFNGILSVAHKFSTAYNSFFTIFNLSWTESAALHISDEDHEEFFASVIFRVYRLFVAATIGLIACMPFVFPLLINVKYFNAYYQIPIYLIASLLNVIQGLYSVIYIALKKSKEVAKTTMVSAGINIIVNIVLIKYIGLYAASISSVAAYGFNSLWRYIDLKHYMDIRFDKKLLISSFASIAIVCIGYYSQSIVWEIICLVYAIIYCIYINREIVIIVLKSPREFKKRMTGK